MFLGAAVVARRLSNCLQYHQLVLEPVQVLAALILIQLSVNAHGQAVDRSPRFWAPIIHRGDQGGFSSS